ncbi:MAG TPA: Mur ligase family protein [Bacteroidales bacterium]|nr:peptidoglycan synthetase [Bacteroidales bacterium]HNZ42342.1 Mur ligase family protein [Bacteroidales bacterium]HOH83143.1 Mur ligase family protein [Bacteroidales bacterium]HPB24818.1 Mur ligase family protein [Bacteroidales bacterium]HPI29730.1 Mur ligase family protein [Bacteroidales bacterium]
MNIHFIAIGGSVMHNMALAMVQNGHRVTGSDDEIFEPAKSRLAAKGILPASPGWFPDKINSGLDAVILGMHAREDNPELIKAKELGLKIYSFPEYIYEQSKNKTRVVIGGSHGKTTITAMIMHVLHELGKDFDYMVGAQLEGFETMFRISDAPVIILEGDEYLTSTLDKRPKFHLYRPNIALLSGVAWDHINVFPTFEIYVDQFRKFIELIEPDGSIVYCENDEELKCICPEARKDIKLLPYGIPQHSINNGTTSVAIGDKATDIRVFGKHNLMNLNGARLVCECLGISTTDFMRAIAGFKGAAKRLELLGKNEDSAFYKDFAHSPSKLRATIDAVKEQFPQRELVACMELHTYSSLNSDFLEQYKGCMQKADKAIVFYSAHALEIKKMPPLPENKVKGSFGRDDITVFTNKEKLVEYLESLDWKGKNLLMMSSGSFDGLDLLEFVKNLEI